MIIKKAAPKMSQRDMIHSPMPVLDSKYASMVTKMDAVMSTTFQSIRRLHSTIQSRCTTNDMAADALISVLRASWAIENSQDHGRQIIANRDKQAYKVFIHTMHGITSHAESIIKKCNQPIPSIVVEEAIQFGGTIMAMTTPYRM